MSHIADCCNGFMAETLNLRSGNRAALEELLSANAPEMKDDFFRLASDTSYWRDIHEEYDQLCDRLGVRNLGFFDHSGVVVSKRMREEGALRMIYDKYR